MAGIAPASAPARGVTTSLPTLLLYGYVDRLKNDYTVILFDARGHGQSDKPHAVEAYNYRLMVDDVIAVLDGDDPNFVHTEEYMKQMPNATFLGLRGHNHVNANTNLDVIVPKAMDFLAQAQ